MSDIKGFDAAQEQYDRQSPPEADARCKWCGEMYSEHDARCTCVDVPDDDCPFMRCSDGNNEFEERDDDEDGREQAAEEKWNENR